jgi:2-dehydro-3-deoxyphosphooctonate aldolase (KDO 8-P synthase)
MSMTNHATSPYTRPIQIGSATLGGGHPFVLLAGPELSDDDRNIRGVISLAEQLSAQTRELAVPFIFRVAVLPRDKRSAAVFDETLSVLREIHDRAKVPVAIDVTEPQHVLAAAEVADLLQIPSGLCRETDLILEAARTGRPVNVEKDPSLTPWDAVAIVDSVAAVGNWNVALTEHGTTVGHDRLVVDFEGFSFLRDTGFPLIFDAGSGELAAKGLTAGADGIALVVRDDTLAALPRLLQQLKGIDQEVKLT